MSGRRLELTIMALAALAACGRIGFDSAAVTAAPDGGGGGDGDGGGGGGGDAELAPPTAHVLGGSTVGSAGVAMTYEADGTHMVFVDTTPGMNGDLIVFREGDGTATLELDVSADGGTTWSAYALLPSNAVGINALGACQDSVGHALHVSWVDTSNADQYARLQPTYSGGDIDGFTIAANFAFFDDYEDSPGPRDVAEVVDGGGHHRLVFAGTANTGSTGRYKLAVTTVAAGLAPTTQDDWAPASDATKTGTDDQLLPNSYATGDGPDTYLVTVSSNLAGGPTAPVFVLGGFPVDRKLLAWTITPGAGADFTVSGSDQLSSAFGGGTGMRTDASLSLANAPSGAAVFVYGEDASSAAPRVHVATASRSGGLVVDSYPQPIASSAARHAVIATDAASRPVVLYDDGAGELLGTYAWSSAWLPAVELASTPTPVAAWSISNPWLRDGVDTFGVYADAGAGRPTRFASVYWQ